MTQFMGGIVGIKPDSIATYCALHADIWPEVVAENRKAGLRNHSIFLLREKALLFSYSEYVGSDRAADRARMAENPVMQQWWNLCRPHQVPLLPSTGPTAGQRLWTDLELVFHHS